jgi:FlaG/FlaF family flagellin (archaellin)
MKGVSDVVAMLLMLVITIGLVSLAYTYISGVFTARIAVVLSIDPHPNSYCNSTHLVVAVRNDGTSASGRVTVVAYNATGASVSQPNCINSIGAGATRECAINRAPIPGAGIYRVVASTPGSTASGVIYCSE